MASRRIRIKGIANIPQRKKSVVTDTNNVSDDTTKTDLDCAKQSGNVTSPDANKYNDEPVPSCAKSDPPDNTDISVTLNTNVSQNETLTNNLPLISQPETAPVKQDPAVLRRKFIKPTVNVINRKSKEKVINENNNRVPEVSKISAEKIVILNDHMIKPAVVEIRSPSPQKPHVFDTQEIICKETCFVGQTTNCEVTPIDRPIKPPPSIHCVQKLDMEYPPPPSSPSKINRSRIKPIPRLHQRKTSFSASESEDETRRQYSRIRNDSVCSTASIAGEASSISECMSPQRNAREFNTVIREKCKKKVHSRKLAEARRQFNMKYYGKMPDRQKLTMIDLIFYNPTTNPMKNESKKKDDDTIIEDELEDDPSKEEDIDDPSVNKSDEENEMPVPQLKVGPDGEIILDEKSLVVENKQTKKGREEIEKSKVIDGDTFDTGYGIYKRAKRSKDWTPSETLRFYKALNIIGTDFTLMCDLFPKRNRRELKLKFKKEEKVNKNLIDKALMNPCTFEYEELKWEVDREEKELMEISKEEEIKARKEKSKATRKSSILSPPVKRLKTANGEFNSDENTQKSQDDKPASRSKRWKSSDIQHINSDADESSLESESEADFKTKTLT